MMQRRTYLIGALLLLLFEPSALFRCEAALTDNLAVYLKFDETLESGAGTSIEGLTALGIPRYVPGKFGEAASFRNNSHVGSPSDWTVILGDLDELYDDSFSVALWLRTGSTLAGAVTGNKDVQQSDRPDTSDRSNTGWLVSTMPGANFSYRMNRRPSIEAGPAHFSDGQWHHVVLLFDRETSSATFYFDGLVLAHGPFAPPGAPGVFDSGSRAFTVIGGSGRGRVAGTADVDDYAIWSRALGAEEVAQLYGAGLEGFPLDEADQAGVIFTDTFPAANARDALSDTEITTTIQAADIPIDPGSVKVFIDQGEVVPKVTPGDAGLTISYQPPNDVMHEWSFNVTKYTRLSADDALGRAGLLGGSLGISRVEGRASSAGCQWRARPAFWEDAPRVVHRNGCRQGRWVGPLKFRFPTLRYLCTGRRLLSVLVGVCRNPGSKFSGVLLGGSRNR